MAEEGKSRLGRGLAALIGEVGDEMGNLERKGFVPRHVPVEFLRPNPRNPRKRFDDDDLQELTQSIKDRGIIQPIVVRPIPNHREEYEIVAGERRWRAAQKAGLHKVPVVVVTIDDKTSLEYAILENVQRADLNPIEESEGYSRLMVEFSYTQENLSKIIGKSRSHIANMLRLADLPVGVRKLLMERKLTAGHGRALLSVKDPLQVAKRVLDEGLSVRQVEEIAQNDNADPAKAETTTAKPAKVEKDPDTRALERALQDVLGLTVSIDHKGKGGELRIKYKTLEQLDGLCRRLNP
ncbi:ParB/RepB/Spo0J family partition protein [Microvirga tunisiensis]|jgi:ParB family chromosome partitioning protein|uniref:ParB/RepB/Spo0J family partition protein n=1 Tax=Microvirga tunisiensis TaxID=2108360 RepID=A0A5N7MMV5_9HYPH|nr:ParB/RepB/Spo0J family partition protein [Microvirga tunisiensis]MPR07025.1 ParB/RepB/Spo0J family partition protein [Microvirga tunisiensis]MPR25316.1 ParB/RepB/Spo0J family partition protein [Microvirga tunisiensis]